MRMRVRASVWVCATEQKTIINSQLAYINTLAPPLLPLSSIHTQTQGQSRHVWQSVDRHLLCVVICVPTCQAQTQAQAQAEAQTPPAPSPQFHIVNCSCPYSARADPNKTPTNIKHHVNCVYFEFAPCANERVYFINLFSKHFRVIIGLD